MASLATELEDDIKSIVDMKFFIQELNVIIVTLNQLSRSGSSKIV